MAACFRFRGNLGLAQHRLSSLYINFSRTGFGSESPSAVVRLSFFHQRESQIHVISLNR